MLADSLDPSGKSGEAERQIRQNWELATANSQRPTLFFVSPCLCVEMERRSKTASLRKKEEKHFWMSFGKRCCLRKNAKAFAKRPKKNWTRSFCPEF